MDELSEVRAPTLHLSPLRVKVKGSGTLWGPNDELDPTPTPGSQARGESATTGSSQGA